MRFLLNWASKKHPEKVIEIDSLESLIALIDEQESPYDREIIICRRDFASKPEHPDGEITIYDAYVE